MTDENLKVCPNCGKEVSKYAESCYYCDYAFASASNPVSVETKSSAVEKATVSTGPNPIFGDKAEPTGCSPWGYAALIIGVNYGIGFLLAFLGTLSGSEDAGYTLMAIGQIGVRLWIGIMAAKAYKKGYPNGGSYFWWILLAFIPIGAWFAIYHAGKYLSWRKSASKQETIQ